MYMHPDSVRFTGLRLHHFIHDLLRLLEPGIGFSFELTKKQGAALVTKHRTYREDIVREATFEEYTKRHYRSWVAFARTRGVREDVRPILVTGVDMTKDFAMMAYSNGSKGLSSTFTISALPAATAGMSLWGKWESKGSVRTNLGPQPRRRSSIFPTFGRKECNQCVFIRYYTVRNRLWVFPRVVKAA